MSKHRTHRIWNRLLSGVLCLALTLGLLPTAGLVRTAQAAHWADPYGQRLVEWGVMKSSSDLRLGATTTRAEFVAMLNRAFGYSRLGSMPFADVPSSAWYAEDINIAYNAGYFKGVSSKKASPTATLTREEAAVMLARCMRLQETVGESLGFTDSRELSEWSRGLIGAIAAEGVINGLPDGSFAPTNNITRGEVAAMLVRAIGTPVNKAGSYDELGGGVVYGRVTISSSDVTLRNTVIDGDLYITGGVDLGNVLLENVTVLGRIVISGGGESHEGRSSIILRNVEADELVVDSMVNQFVTVSAYGLTNIENTYVRSDCYLDDSCDPGHGLHYIELAGKKGTKLQLAGSIKEVKNKTRLSLLQLVRGTAEKITIDENATGSELLIDYNTVVRELNLEVATRVYGKGDIIDLNIGADGCEVEILPQHVDIRPGLTATLGEGEDKKTIGSTEASELSSEPRLLSGYPSVSKNLRPTSAEGLYAVNKPGTIYWAVSAIADGSVSRDDLVNNPAYGGNILKDGEVPQSGSIDASARTDYSRMITGLEPDGSYYISAVLVDERGNYSPLKVFSFSTPDDTTPDFVDTPYMSKVSCEVAQVTAMANKSCTLYWVLLESGATRPTVSNFKTGSFGGNYGSGSMSVVKNVPVSIQVNGGRLQEKTGYDLYLWLNDLDGAKCSEVIKVVNADTNRETDPSFITPDETAPVVTSITQTNFNLTDAIEFTFTINEAPSTLYWAVVTATDTTFIKATDDLNSLRTQLKLQNGTGAIVSNSKAAAGAEAVTQVSAADFANKLSYDKYKTHNFRLYYMAKDADGNCSEVRSIIIHTLDNEPPTVTIDFSSAMYNTEADKAAGRKPRPQADSNIMLIFSEQVKGDGGEAAQTFVDLYSEVKRWEDLGLKDGDSLLDNAKNTLGAELEKHITLYYLQGRTERKLEKPTADSPLYGWIDWREAIVELQADGRVVLTLPAGKAVQLGGGMEYYFHFENIFDDSYTSNPLMVVRDDGTIDGGITSSGVKDTDCDMDSFTTVYAQVWLDPDETGISKIENGAADPGGLNDTRLDIVVNATPQSIGNLTSDDCWDMIIWSDTPARFVVYRRISSNEGASWTAWEQMTDEIRATKNVPLSLSRYKSDDYLGSDLDRYETIKDGLLKDVIYQYGIRFTSLNGDDWADPIEEPEAWSSLVTMSFSLVAGTRNNITNLATSVERNYDRYVEDGTVNEIGSARTDSATETILRVEKQFTDKRPPAFQSNSPTFTATSSTISMNVYLNRTGILYYVAIPADELFPTFGGVSVTPSNDGRTIDNGVVPESGANAVADVNDYFSKITNAQKTYIPISGKDRDDNKAHIYFAPVSDTVKGGVYGSPVYDDIYDGAVYTYNSEYAVAGSFEYTALMNRTVPLDGGSDQHNLKPDTWYYVYVVLRSDSGTFDDVVQVYRVKTAKTEPPAIRVNRVAVPESVSGVKGGSTTTGVSMTVQNRGANTAYDNPMLYYALARKDDLPSQLTTIYNWTGTAGTVGETGNGPVTPQPTTPSGSQMSVLDAIITKWNGTNQSYFDHFAGSTLKNWVRSYITEATTNNTYGSSLIGYDPVNENSRQQECLNDMQQGGEYVMLVCARHYYSTESDGTEYGFAAAQGLFKPDGDPPVFIGKQGLNEIDIQEVYNQNGNRTTVWGTATDLTGYTFTGSITISFDKAIYTYDNGVLKQIVGGTVASGSDAAKSQVAMIDLIKTSDAITRVSATSDGRNFTIYFTRLGSGRTITLGNLYNSSGVKSDYTLTLTFRPVTKLGQVDPGTYTPDMWAPCFNITWAK